MEEHNITISAERYVELVRNEQVGQMLTGFINERVDGYKDITLAELRILKTLICGYVGEEE